MAPDTNADVLRRHGLTILADWAENALIAPQYARQSAYWASVLCEPEIPEFAEWPMEGARGFEFEADHDAELPEADLPFLFPLIGVAAAVRSSIHRRITRRRCHGKREPTRNCGRITQPPGVDQGSISY